MLVATHALWPLWGSVPELSVVQVPSAPPTSHASQLPVQALSQQIPSGEQVVPLTQPAATVTQAWPFLLLQVPVASQVPAQRPLGSSALTAETQVWLAEHV